MVGELEETLPSFGLQGRHQQSKNIINKIYRRKHLRWDIHRLFASSFSLLEKQHGESSCSIAYFWVPQNDSWWVWFTWRRTGKRKKKSIWIVSHEDSFWQRGKRQLQNGLSSFCRASEREGGVGCCWLHLFINSFGSLPVLPAQYRLSH